MSRITTRIFLGLALILALAVAGFSLSTLKGATDPAWATLAAALAVVTAIISAWGAQRVVELEEDKLRPYPYPYFDASSRYGLMLFRVTNSGGGAAHDIDLVWDEPLTNSEGKRIRFSPERSSPEIPVLMPGQSVSMIVDGHISFFRTDKKHEYTGYIKFKDGSGRKFKNRFVLDAEMYRDTPYYDTEELKTHHEIQKLPAKVEKIQTELAKIRAVLKKKEKNIES